MNLTAQHIVTIKLQEAELQRLQKENAILWKSNLGLCKRLDKLIKKTEQNENKLARVNT